MKVALLLALLIAVVLAQQKPVWPTAASASIFVEGWGDRREDRHFLRWFYDTTAGKERIDGPREHRGELFWTTTLIDTKLHKEWFVVHQHSLVECWTGTRNTTIPHPNFANARYAGKAEIDYQVVDHWVERSPEGRDFIHVFDRADNQEIKRVDFEDPRLGRSVTFHYHEYDAGAQDPSLWVLPSAILAICNNVQ